jgi:CDP-diglyceride synthetase
MNKYKIEFKWAIIYCVMVLLWMTLEVILGLHGEHIDLHMVTTMFFLIPMILLYIYALLDKKKNYYSGNMNYTQGFVTGIIITVIITLLSPLTQYITSEFITPDFFTNAIECRNDSRASSKSL